MIKPWVINKHFQRINIIQLNLKISHLKKELRLWLMRNEKVPWNCERNIPWEIIHQVLNVLKIVISVFFYIFFYGWHFTWSKFSLCNYLHFPHLPNASMNIWNVLTIIQKKGELWRKMSPKTSECAEESVAILEIAFFKIPQSFSSRWWWSSTTW